MKIVIFNVRFSPNLGDGLLAECLERQLGAALPGSTIETVDLAGRAGYGHVDSRRFGAMRLLGKLPRPVRHRLVEHVLGMRLAALRSIWQAKIAGADAVIIGGGNLFQDDDLNFPMKIAQVLELCHAERCPVGVYAVGVGRKWSPRAAALFGTLRKCEIFHVSVRDAGALENWQAHFNGECKAAVAPDPALTLSGTVRSRKHRRRPVVGLCVTHPVVLRRHSSGRRNETLLGAVHEYCTLAQSLVEAGCDVVFFTNGALEDQSCLERIQRSLSGFAARSPDRCSFAKRPVTPDHLISLIGNADAIAGHRLHACIAAYALGVASVGLGWDQKVEAFFQMTGREPFFVPVHTGSVQTIGERILAALENGIDFAKRRHCTKAARRAVASLAESLDAAETDGVINRYDRLNHMLESRLKT